MMVELDDPLVTIGTALTELDPPIPRRSLARLLAGLEPAGLVPVEHGGPAAKAYRWSEVLRAHADWCGRKSQASC